MKENISVKQVKETLNQAIESTGLPPKELGITYKSNMVSSYVKYRAHMNKLVKMLNALPYEGESESTKETTYACIKEAYNTALSDTHKLLENIEIAIAFIEVAEEIESHNI